jgi:hypothetical protein
MISCYNDNSKKYVKNFGVETWLLFKSNPPFLYILILGSVIIQNSELSEELMVSFSLLAFRR